MPVDHPRFPSAPAVLDLAPVESDVVRAVGALVHEGARAPEFTAQLARLARTTLARVSPRPVPPPEVSGRSASVGEPSEPSEPTDDGPLARDRALARRAVERDEAAWTEIFQMAQEILYAAAWSFGQASAREDLLQDVMERLVRKIHTYRGESPLRMWVASVCYNRLRNAYRAKVVRDRVMRPLPPAAPEPPAPTRTHAVESERELTAAAMAGLREPHWNVVLLRMAAELSVAETARVLGVEEGTVKSRLSRALAELRLFVLVLRGTPLPQAAKTSGMKLAAARARVEEALPGWRRQLPPPLLSAVEWRLNAEPGRGR